MEYEYRVAVHFEDWMKKEMTKAQCDREMLRRKKMRKRLAKKFNEYKPVLDNYFVRFYNAPAEFEQRLRKYASNVPDLEIVKTEMSPPKAAPKPKTFAPKPAVMSAAEVKAVLKSKGILICSDEKKQRVVLPAVNRTRGGAKAKDIATAAKALGRELMPSHRRLLQISDGCALLADASRRDDTGLVIYSTKQLVKENKRIRKMYGNEAEQALGQKLLVGEPAGYGNWIAANYQRVSKLGEAPIVFVDHEGGSADGRTVADSFEDLIRKIKTDAIELLRRGLDGSVVYSDGKRELTPLEFKAGRS